MSSSVTCPTLDHILTSELCTENFAGVGSVVYVGLISDLSAPLTAEKELYSEPVFSEGKGLYKIDCKEETSAISGASLGANKGFRQSLNFTVEEVTPRLSQLARAMNNRQMFFIVPDGDDYQILYSPTRKIKPAADAITSNTGAAATDARETTFAYTLGPVEYMNNYVTITDIEALLYIEPVS